MGAPDNDFAAVPYVRPGQLISLISWTLVDGEWVYATIIAEYRRRDSGSWHVVTDGQRVTLDRSTWAIFT